MNCIATFNGAEILKSDHNLFAEIKRYIIKETMKYFPKRKHSIFSN